MRIPVLKIEGNDDGMSQLANIRETARIVEDWYNDEYSYVAYEFEYYAQSGSVFIEPLDPGSLGTSYGQGDFFDGVMYDFEKLADYLESAFGVNTDIIFL
jgi:hypothetical protein